MKNNFKKKAILGTLGLATLGVLSASAMGFGGMNPNISPDEMATRQSTMFQQKATLIGATVDEVKTAWAEGKSFSTLATEKGITKEQLQAKMKALRDQAMKKQLDTLVSKGVITQAQADKRLATMLAKKSTEKANNKGHRMHGDMMGNGF